MSSSVYYFLPKNVSNLSRFLHREKMRANANAPVMIMMLMMMARAMTVEL